MLWKQLKMRTLMALAVTIALGFGAAPVSAGKPSWAGGGKEKHGKSYQQEGKGNKAGKTYARSKGGKSGIHFGNYDRNTVRDYYDNAFRKGKGCPPGLAKKRNGCMPPGQAKKRWTYGQPLPRDVVFHDLPRQLIAELPAPPGGYRYVRVVTDILLIAIGTAVVIDAIQDLGEI
jgi:Ni/Co efflux regulator RcnB